VAQYQGNWVALNGGNSAVKHTSSFGRTEAGSLSFAYKIKNKKLKRKKIELRIDLYYGAESLPVAKQSFVITPR
jgi:hypothetical protein